MLFQRLMTLIMGRQTLLRGNFNLWVDLATSALPISGYLEVYSILISKD